jgi:hypothetical protein
VTCAFEPCDVSTLCALSGGCVVRRFPRVLSGDLVARDREGREDAKAFNGTKPRASRDPRFIKRRRKALTP